MPPRGGVNRFLGGRKPLDALQHGKFDQQIYQSKYICFHNFFVIRELETKDNYLGELWYRNG